MYTWEAVTVIEKDLRDAPYDVVIGRDMLARCVLTYNGKAGTFRLEVR
jgi:hypothetical protein